MYKILYCNNPKTYGIPYCEYNYTVFGLALNIIQWWLDDIFTDRNM